MTTPQLRTLLHPHNFMWFIPFFIVDVQFPKKIYPLLFKIHASIEEKYFHKRICPTRNMTQNVRFGSRAAVRWSCNSNNMVNSKPQTDANNEWRNKNCSTSLVLNYAWYNSMHPNIPFRKQPPNHKDATMVHP